MSAQPLTLRASGCGVPSPLPQCITSSSPLIPPDWGLAPRRTGVEPFEISSAGTDSRSARDVEPTSGPRSIGGTKLRTNPAFVIPQDDPAIMVYFAVLAMWGFTTSFTPSVFKRCGACRRIAIPWMGRMTVQEILFGGIMCLHAGNYCTSRGAGSWDQYEKISNTMVVKVLDGVVTTIVMLSFGLNIFMVGKAFRVEEPVKACVEDIEKPGPSTESVRRSDVEELWALHVRKEWWYGCFGFRYALILSPVVSVSLIVAFSLISMPCFTRLVYLVITQWSVVGCAIFVSGMRLTEQMIRNVKDEFNDANNIDHAMKLVKYVKNIQTFYLSDDGYLAKLEGMAGLNIGVSILQIMFNIYLIASIKSFAGSRQEADESIRHLGTKRAFQIVAISIGIFALLLPPLYLTSACEALVEQVNALMGRLVVQATEANENSRLGTDRDADEAKRLETGVALIAHFDQHLQCLNKRQGMGSVVLSVRISFAKVKAIGVAIAGILTLYLPDFLAFYFPTSGANLLSTTITTTYAANCSCP